jgi:hypothetical protein
MILFKLPLIHKMAGDVTYISVNDSEKKYFR